MKTKFYFSFLLLFVFILDSTAQTAPPKNPNWVEAPEIFTRQFQERTFVPNVPEASSRADQDWSTVIDSIWGTGASTADKLEAFDTYWNTIDTRFACFQDIDDQWDALYDLYRPEIEQGVSRGRFVAIMDQLSLSLRESHTKTNLPQVHYNTQLLPGVPLMMVGGWGNNFHFGAGLTPLPDESLLVYKVASNHPLDLELGDIVLGYDDLAWSECYPQLLDANLPLTGWWWGSSPSSFDHSFLMAAGLNWHLFDTIDIVKYDSGDTIHLATSALMGQNSYLFCTEQMDVPGVPKPNYNGQELFSYGLVEGTNIGYIYGWGWFWDAQAEFLEAVSTVMNDYDTEGLIIDFRMNYGGNMFLSDPGLDLLFAENTPTIDWVYRCDNDDHLGLCESNIESSYYFGQGPDGYDKPIALLTGPGAISSGDQVALRIKFHPQTRTFGKSTSTAFNAPSSLDFTVPNWTGRFAEFDAYLLSEPGDYLTHNEFVVDEEVWHNPDDVANEEDAVVNAAINWINSFTTSTTEINNIENLELFPNPVINQLSILNSEFDGATLDVTLFTIQGKQISSQLISSFQKIKVTGLTPGMYLIKIKSNGKVYSGKFIKI